MDRPFLFFAGTEDCWRCWRSHGYEKCCSCFMLQSIRMSFPEDSSGYIWVQSRNAMVQGYFEPQILICVNHLRLGHPNPTHIRCKKSKNWELKWWVSNGCKFRRMSKSRSGEFGRWGLKCVDQLTGKKCQRKPSVSWRKLVYHSTCSPQC